MSVDAGARIDFKINVNDLAGSDYKVEVFRLGYYGGDGAREVAEWTNTDATVQPSALYDATRGLVDAGNWSVTDSWQVPEDAVSGVYLVRLQRLDADGNPIDGRDQPDPLRRPQRRRAPRHRAADLRHHLAGLQRLGRQQRPGRRQPLRRPERHRRLGPDRRAPAPHSQDRAYAVSYNRPIITDTGESTASGAQDYLFGADYAAIQWLEKNGYDVAYISGVDTDRLGADYLKNYKAFISVGHDEYWSGGQRANVEAARDAGVNLLFWSGNECYWKTRWDVAISADGTEYRTLVCYKETLAVADPNAGPEDYVNLDPTDIWTGTWRDIRFHGNPLAGGGELATSIRSPASVPTATAARTPSPASSSAPTAPASSAAPSTFRPNTPRSGCGATPPSPTAASSTSRRASSATSGTPRPTTCCGRPASSSSRAPRSPGTASSSTRATPSPGHRHPQPLALPGAESGALVFGAGTTFWSWGLSDAHASSPYGAQIDNTDLQQFTINMFADMGIQPGVSDAFLISQGLKRATASDDHVAATAAIDNPARARRRAVACHHHRHRHRRRRQPLTADGKVAVVEVSTDGGATWRVANTTDGWAHWSYTWQPAGEGNYTVKARAIDDSLNVATIVADSETVTVAAPDSYSFFNGAPRRAARPRQRRTPPSSSACASPSTGPAR